MDMTAPELVELLEEWRAFTAKEGEAIRALDWLKVEECQSAKERLMNEIAAREQRENDSGDRGQWAKDLMELERQNERELAEVRATLESERARIDRAGRAARQLSQAYRSQSRANWQSYS